MRIGKILDKPFPPDPRIENEASSLIGEGHEVHLFCYDGVQSSDQEKYEMIDDLHVHRSTVGKITRKLSALAYTVPLYHYIMWRKIARFIREVNPDVLHVHDMVVARSVFWANKRYRLPVVMDLHENRPEIMRMYRHVNRFPGNFLINLDKWHRSQRELIKKADRVIVVTEEAKQQFLGETNIEPEKVLVVPNSIRQRSFYNHPVRKDLVKRLTSRFTLLYVGDTSIRRGTDTAIKAVSGLVETIPDVYLVLVGVSSEDDKLLELAETLNLTEEYVSFEGWQDVSLFPSYISGAAVCLCPLKRNLHHDTTYANKLFQYMAMGKPLIVSDCTSQSNLVRQEMCGLVHRAGDENDLADKILTLYRDREMRLNTGARAKDALLNRYCWEQVDGNLIDLYNELEKVSMKN